MVIYWIAIAFVFTVFYLFWSALWMWNVLNQIVISINFDNQLNITSKRPAIKKDIFSSFNCLLYF